MNVEMNHNSDPFLNNDSMTNFTDNVFTSFNPNSLHNKGS